MDREEELPANDGCWGGGGQCAVPEAHKGDTKWTPQLRNTNHRKLGGENGVGRIVWERIGDRVNQNIYMHV